MDYNKKGKKSKSESELIEIWEHTCKLALQNFPIEDEKEQTFSINEKDIESFYKVLKEEEKETSIQVIEGDCVNIAREFVSDGYKVCMLNMASKWKPGGGVFKGKMAQEEHLCRLSNLYLFLSTTKYPLEDFQCLVSPNVTFFKDTDYTKLRKPWNCHIISMAAYQVAKPSHFSKPMYEGTIQKIKVMLTAAKKVDHDVLILSAFGCGAYNNPNDLVAKAFYQVLVEEAWSKKFKKIVFAIYDDKNSNGNLQAFKDQFK